MATKRGQAALEFLSTYGFAFLIILVMVGALTYFGVLKPSNLLPSRCLLSTEFECDDYRLVRLTGTNHVRLDMQFSNRLGETVTLLSASANSTNYGQQPTCTLGTTSIAPGGISNISCSMTVGPTGAAGAASFPAVGEKVRVSVDLSYQKVGGAYPQRLGGEVLATIQ
jgi:hypothetical protein